jgi:hypothetical protein
MEAAAVLAAMQNPELQADAEQVAVACLRLRVICREDRGCATCDQFGVSEVVYHTMAKHIEAPAVQLQGCAVFANLCAGENLQARRDRAVVSGALRAVVHAMARHSDYRTLHEIAVIALQNICYGSDPTGAARRAAAVESGAVRALVESIEMFEDGLQDAYHQRAIDNNEATLELLGVLPDRQDSGGRSSFMGRLRKGGASLLGYPNPNPQRADATPRSADLASAVAETQQDDGSPGSAAGAEGGGIGEEAMAAEIKLVPEEGSATPRTEHPGRLSRPATARAANLSPEKVERLRTVLANTEKRRDQLVATLAEAEEALQA